MPFSGAEFLPTQSIQSVLGVKPERSSSVPPPPAAEYSSTTIYRPPTITCPSPCYNADYSRISSPPNLPVRVIRPQQLHVVPPPPPIQQGPMSVQMFRDQDVSLQYGPIEGGPLGDTSTKVFCKYCDKYVKTIIKREVGTANFLAATLACICLPCTWLGCQCIPFFVDDWKDAVHYCDNCGRKVGSYNALAENP